MKIDLPTKIMHSAFISTVQLYWRHDIDPLFYLWTVQYLMQNYEYLISYFHFSVCLESNRRPLNCKFQLVSVMMLDFKKSRILAPLAVLEQLLLHLFNIAMSQTKGKMEIFPEISLSGFWVDMFILQKPFFLFFKKYFVTFILIKGHWTSITSSPDFFLKARISVL